MKTVTVRSSLLFWALMSVACGGTSVTNTGVGSVDLPSSGDGGNEAGSAGAFYVRALQDDDHPMTTYMHKFGDFAAACEILPSETAKDVKCLLNIRELDLNFYGLKLEMNAPPSMCDYVGESPYWYYDKAIGVGARSISVDINDSGGSVHISSCTVDGVPGSVSSTLCTFADGTVDVDGKVTCKYDHTASDGPNCCIGTYSGVLTKTIGTDVTSVEISGSYAGNYGACVAGPGSQVDWPKTNTKDKYPMSRLYAAEASGLKVKFDIKPPQQMSNGDDRNVHGANMYGWSDYNSTFDNAASTIPQAIRPTTDASGPIFALPRNEAYTYNCYDKARELKHRIRVYVNEWNSSSDFLTYGSTLGVTRLPNTSGVDGIGCDSGDSLGGSNCNDYIDWDDLGSAFPH